MPKGTQQKVIDRIGQRIGKLTVISRAENIDEASRVGKLAMRAVWLCQCDCGNRINVSSHSLKHALEGKGGTRSCGCLFGKHMIKHGMVGTGVYYTWNMMRQRCTNPKNAAYKSYGGRGIKVCDAWMESFAAFFKDMGPPPKGCSIDRIDVNGNYEPSNCRWATRREQGNNRRTNLMLAHSGKTQSLADWARETGLSTWCITNRIKSGWSTDRALTEPKNSHRKATPSTDLN